MRIVGIDPGVNGAVAILDYEKDKLIKAEVLDFKKEGKYIDIRDVKEMINYIETNNLNITIVLIGNIDADIQSKHFIKTGNYSKQEVPALIKKLKIDEFFIPSVWPETYSYTTDEIMQLGYPITVFNLGAPAERVQKYPLGKIVDFDNYLQELCD